MIARHRRWIALSVLTLMLLALPGCNGGAVDKKHAEYKAAATKRWLEMRSGLMLQMAQRQFDTGDLDQAEKSLGEAMNMDAANPRLFVLAGRVAIERGQLERGYHLLSRAAELAPNIAEAQYYQGLVLQRWQRYADALERYQAAYRLAPDSAAHLLACSEMLLALDRNDDALAALTDKMAYFDQNAGIRLAIAQIHMLKRQPAEAVKFYQAAALLQPDDPRILEDMAIAQIAAGQAAQAVGTLDHLLVLPKQSDRRELHRLRADALMAAGRPGDAKALYIKLTHSDPSDVDAWVRAGEACWATDDLTGAMLAAGRIIALAPRRHEGHLLQGMVWQRRQQFNQAIRSFDEAAQLAPTSAEPLILRGMALEQAGYPAQAAEAYRQALTRRPDDERVQRLLSNVASAPASP